MHKILSIVGARPQFIKCASISRVIRGKVKEVLVHTGQHYDVEMSKVFFDELGIPLPDYNLEVGSGSHAEQTATIMLRLEKVLVEEKPLLVLVYGDTNSTLAGALTAVKLQLPVAHVEAGLRSYNKQMPEEINRVATDHISDLLFCPTQTAVSNLEKEGIIQGVYNTGDVMYDSLLHNLKLSNSRKSILQKVEVRPGEYYLVTVHRQSNTAHIENLKTIFEALSQLDLPVVFPVHPGTRKIITGENLFKSSRNHILLIDPVSYLEMLQLLKNAKKVLTDSGGVQKESYFMKVPCITLRDETEWVETLENGCNVLTGIDKRKIVEAVYSKNNGKYDHAIFGDGSASIKISQIIYKFIIGEP
ncbi:MAG: non-hydrolyzing UDP-N-acetylglucosamine 2-epimerase [Fidelibacterota bacterium]